MSHRIMVYGTLKKGHGNNYLLRSAKFIGQCETVDKFVLMDFGGFPGLFPAQKGFEPTKVEGELWEVNDATLARCDQLEGHPDWYRRTPIRVQCPAPHVLDMADETDGVACEVYMLSRVPHGVQCEQGKWPREPKKIKLQPA